MFKIITKYKHKIFIKNVLALLESERYILKDYLFNEYWCMALFIKNKLIFVKNNQKNNDFNIRIFNSKKELLDFKFWNNEDYQFLKVLIDKSHDKNFKKTFLIEKTEYIIEDLSNFLRDRNNAVNLNITKSSQIIECLLSKEFSSLYINTQINDGKKLEGKIID